MNTYTEDKGEMFKEHTPADIPHFPIKEVYEHKSEMGQEYVEVQNTQNIKVNDRYTMAVQFLQSREGSFVISKPYSLTFYVDGRGLWEYFPKKNRLHERDINKWHDNGFDKLVALYK